MKKWGRFLAGIVILCIIYIVFLIVVDKKESTGSSPIFDIPSSTLTASVNDDESKLLEGIKVTDNEDGDLSSKVFVESISGFDDNSCRTVTYGVFDSDDNLTRAMRTIQYIDYQKPTISLSKAVCYTNMHIMSDFKQFATAESIVDGDLTSKITVESEYYEGNDEYVVFSVTDSCGTKETLTVKAEMLKTEPNIDIKLREYLIRVPVGTQINAKDYIEKISGTGMTEKALRNELQMTNDYNPNEKGMYEFVYRIALANGDYGLTKLVVIVE